MKFNKFFLTLIAISTLKAIVRTPAQEKELHQNINLADQFCYSETFESQEQRFGRNPEDTPEGLLRDLKKAANLQDCLEMNRIATTSVPDNNKFWDFNFTLD